MQFCQLIMNQTWPPCFRKGLSNKLIERSRTEHLPSIVRHALRGVVTCKATLRFEYIDQLRPGWQSGPQKTPAPTKAAHLPWSRSRASRITCGSFVMPVVTTASFYGPCLRVAHFIRSSNNVGSPCCLPDRIDEVRFCTARYRIQPLILTDDGRRRKNAFL